MRSGNATCSIGRRFGEVESRMSHNADETGTDRRAFLKAALYVAPVVMTLKAKTAYAQLGSSRPPTNTGGTNPTNNQNNGQRTGTRTCRQRAVERRMERRQQRSRPGPRQLTNRAAVECRGSPLTATLFFCACAPLDVVRPPVPVRLRRSPSHPAAEPDLYRHARRGRRRRRRRDLPNRPPRRRLRDQRRRSYRASPKTTQTWSIRSTRR